MVFYRLLAVAMLRDMFYFFFFNDTATTEIYTLSLHDALPISEGARARQRFVADYAPGVQDGTAVTLRRCAMSAQGVCANRDRKSTRLNSSHSQISYAVFCLKKKKRNEECKRGRHTKIRMTKYD